MTIISALNYAYMQRTTVNAPHCLRLRWILAKQWWLWILILIVRVKQRLFRGNPGALMLYVSENFTVVIDSWSNCVSWQCLTAVLHRAHCATGICCWQAINTIATLFHCSTSSHFDAELPVIPQLLGGCFESSVNPTVSLITALLDRYVDNTTSEWNITSIKWRRLLQLIVWTPLLSFDLMDSIKTIFFGSGARQLLRGVVQSDPIRTWHRFAVALNCLLVLHLLLPLLNRWRPWTGVDDLPITYVTATGVITLTTCCKGCLCHFGIVAIARTEEWRWAVAQSAPKVVVIGIRGRYSVSQRHLVLVMMMTMTTPRNNAVVGRLMAKRGIGIERRMQSVMSMMIVEWRISSRGTTASSCTTEPMMCCCWAWTAVCVVQRHAVVETERVELMLNVITLSFASQRTQ